MSIEKTSTPDQDTQATETRQITVAVPEDRVQQFQALYERFLTAGEYGRRRHGRGRHGDHRRHHIRRAMYHLAMAEHGSGPEHGNCRRRRGAEDSSAAESTPTVQI